MAQAIRLHPDECLYSPPSYICRRPSLLSVGCNVVLQLLTEIVDIRSPDDCLSCICEMKDGCAVAIHLHLTSHMHARPSGARKEGGEQGSP